MPPRFAYWTILIDGAPTAFRAREREELLPTLNQLGRKNADVALRYFARGKLWDSPEQAQWAGKNPRPFTEERGREWRPGGTHADPRARFDKKPPRAPQARENHGESRRPHDRDPQKPWGARQDGGRSGRPPVGDRPREDARRDRPQDGDSKPAAGAKPAWRDKPWTPKPPGGTKRPWTPRPEGGPGKPLEARKEGSSSRPPAGNQRKPWETRRDNRSDRPHDRDERKPWGSRKDGEHSGGHSGRPPVGDRPRENARRDQRQDGDAKSTSGSKPAWRDKPWAPKPPGGAKRPWTPRPEGEQRKPWNTRKDAGGSGRPPTTNQRTPWEPRGDDRQSRGPRDRDQRKPWETRKDGGHSSRPPSGDRPREDARRDRPRGDDTSSTSGAKPAWRDKPWTPKPAGSAKRPWTPRPEGEQRKPWDRNKDRDGRKPKPRG